MTSEERNIPRNRDLVLPPRTQAYVLDTTKGKVAVHVGPSKTSLSDTDRLVQWDKTKRQFVECADPHKVTVGWAEAGEGQYIVLSDPAKNPEKAHPSTGAAEDAIELSVGCKVIIPGPATFALWPGQTAETIDGHRMATNQYVVVRVCQPYEAEKNWKSDTDIHFEMGQLMIIKGADVSFYIPSTGFEVVPDEDGKFVRSAVTLEQLEYSILLDENGKKRYVRGPDVVFPEPTETFITQDGQRKFPAVELSPQSGIYVKVTAAYEENGKAYYVGDELFITGNEMPFYFPRAEHSVIKYGDRTRHHAIAIPEGEGRYVLNRNTGVITLVRGPIMYLPNPINEVIVKRILDPETVRIMYPNNKEALEVNEKYVQQQQAQQKQLEQQARSRHEFGHQTNSVLYGSCSTASNTGNVVFGASAGSCDAMFDNVSGAAEAYSAKTVIGDRVTNRNTTYSAPRSIVLDTKYEGAVSVSIWPGYAVCVMDKGGKRRVEVGPKTILLGYDESLMVLELSTGTPKEASKTLKTCYLRVINNAISDKVYVETSDLVPVVLSLSYHVAFDGSDVLEIEKWFNVENYVKLLTDSCRSRLRKIVKQFTIHEFIQQGTDIVRDCLLGLKLENEERPSLKFKENGMRLYDVEVLHTQVNNPAVAELLNVATYRTLEGVVKLTTEQAEAARQKAVEELKRDIIAEVEKTAKADFDIVLEGNRRKYLAERDNLDKQSLLTAMAHKINSKAREDEKAAADLRHEIRKAYNDVELERLTRETELRTQSVAAINDNMIAALNTFGDREFVARISTALGPAALAAGMTTAELLSQLFKGTPWETTLSTLGGQPFKRQIAE